MKKNRFWIYIMTALLLGILGMGLRKAAEQDMTIVLEVTTEEGTEEISCWELRYDKEAFLFIPSCVDLTNARLRVPKENTFFIDGIPVTDGMSCDTFERNVFYPLVVPEGGELVAEKIMFVKSNNVGSVFLETKSGDMTYLHGNKKNKESGAMRLYDQNGNLRYNGALSQIKGRGQSSWAAEKKSYNITLEKAEDLLGMGKAENWVLQANAKDVSNLRNKIVYDSAIAAGIAFTPECQWVDLYLNGEYAGLYLLGERIEIHPQRVDIPKENSFLMVQDGSWRFEADGDPFFVTRQNTALGIRYSAFDRVDLQQIWQTTENAILAEDGIDPVSGKSWTECIDLTSWVKKYLLEEVFFNVDAMTLSQYYYLDGSRGDGRICAGPPWDYDLTMSQNENELIGCVPNRLGSTWFPALYAKDSFYQALREEYHRVFRPILVNLLEGGLEQYWSQIQDASYMNNHRWQLYWNTDDVSYKELAEAVGNRMAFLDRLWVEEEPFVMVYVEGYARYYYRAVEPGSLLPPLPEVPETITSYQWVYADTGEEVDLQKPIWEDTSVILQYEAPSVPTQGAAGEETSFSLTQWGILGTFVMMTMLIVLAECRKNRRYHGRTKEDISARTEI